MQQFQRWGGIAAIALTALGVSACYPPPPGTVAYGPNGEPIALLPHLGSATTETRNAMGFLALDGIDTVLAGQMPPNSVN